MAGKRLTWAERFQDPIVVALTVLAAVGVGTAAYTAYALWTSTFSGAQVRMWAPTVSVAIATASLLLSALTYNRAARRGRADETLRMWSSWQDSTRQVRRNLRESADRFDTSQKITAMMNDRHRKVDSGATAEERMDISLTHDVVTVLNGLERLGDGCQFGHYDIRQIERLGRRVVLENINRYRGFITAARAENGEAWESVLWLDKKLGRNK